MKKKCIFCKKYFPLQYQTISSNFKYWYFVHDVNPICDFHCQIVIKKEYLVSINTHIEDISSEYLSNEILSELGIILNKAGITIKKANKNIKQINIVSTNSGEFSKHLHFHLIPIFYNEKVQKINNKNKDGSGINFLARKEVVQDTMEEFIYQTCGNSSQRIMNDIRISTKKRVTQNVKILKKFFTKKN